VGNGNIDVGNKSPTRESGRPAVEPLTRNDGASGLRNGKVFWGAMLLQDGDSGRGTESAPQKFVHLVGCRDPKMRTAPWTGPRPVAVKG
jgi:hypothetical protein